MGLSFLLSFLVADESNIRHESDMQSNNRMILSKGIMKPHSGAVASICVTWVSSLPRPFKRRAAGLSPVTHMGETDVITDSSISHRSKNKKRTRFSQATFLLDIPTLKWYFSDKRIRRKLTLFRISRCLCKTLSRELDGRRLIICEIRNF